MKVSVRCASGRARQGLGVGAVAIGGSPGRGGDVGGSGLVARGRRQGLVLRAVTGEVEGSGQWQPGGALGVVQEEAAVGRKCEVLGRRARRGVGAGTLGGMGMVRVSTYTGLGYKPYEDGDGVFIWDFKKLNVQKKMLSNVIN
ncbi:hypothetical protein PR202_ga07472 [Eleusine coracana subsp. coracana]|uniref:Uncharacterized protein n=1 Tax=Eleusine coracana subsp. coracana TaxID=191504 RepID=A0AAV5BXL9_ELECO|nr:hypothetical protein PR202_ga07472 [Eleusine coracana subsp. coracana]